MMKIAFVRRWDGKKENTWSGTPYGILSNLMILKPNQIDEIPIEYNAIQKGIIRFIRGTNKFLSIDGCNYIDNLIQEHIVSNSVKCDKQPIIVFDECITKKIKNTYLFVDCSVDYALRSIVSGDEIGKYVPLRKKRSHSLIGIRHKRAMKFYKECKGIFTMGNWCAEDFINHTGIPAEKVHPVGGGINISEKEIDNSFKSGNKFLFVGKEFDRKNGPLVVEAFKILNQNNNGKYELYIAGPKEWPLSIDIPEGVHFLGRKNQDELSKYYNLCDVFVMPSIFEAYGIVFAEALIYGLPVIARNAFSMCDFITHGENGYLLNANSAFELSELMDMAINNEGMRSKVIQDKEKYLLKYSWKTVAEKICKQIENDGYAI